MATVARRSSCGGNPANVGPHHKRTPPLWLELTGGDVAAAKVESDDDARRPALPLQQLTAAFALSSGLVVTSSPIKKVRDFNTMN
jgi:hypothetical protein